MHIKITRGLTLSLAALALFACENDKNLDSTPTVNSSSGSSYTISGTVAGLKTGKTVSLKLNDAASVDVAADGTFSFTSKLIKDSPFVVSVGTQPSGKNCAVTNNSGTVAEADVSNVTVACGCSEGFGGDACAGLEWSKLSVGGSRGFYATNTGARAHLCGVRGGELYCSGLNSSGQLGLGHTKPVLGLQRVGTESDWSSVSVGGNFTCGIRAGGLYCWGANSTENKSNISVGMLGLGTTFDTIKSVTTPTQVGALTTWVDISSSKHFACGRQDDGTNKTLWCWGRNNNDNLGQGDSTDRNEPVQVGTDTDWTALALSQRPEVVGLRAGALYGFGNDQIGLGTSGTPAQIGSTTTWTDIAPGAGHFCGLHDGMLECADDYGNHGAGGDGDIGSDPLAAIGVDTDWTKIASGYNHSCAVKGGNVACWGRGYEGELGLGQDMTAYDDENDLVSDGNDQCEDDQEETDSKVWHCHTPIQVAGVTNPTLLSAGVVNTCATVGADLFCWGSNTNGQLGSNNASVIWTPTLVN